MLTQRDLDPGMSGLPRWAERLGAAWPLWIGGSLVGLVVAKALGRP